MKYKIVYAIITFLIIQISTAQVLFTETFDNLALGELCTDITGATPGKGGWYVRKIYPNNPAPCEVVAEAGRGKVLSIGANIGDGVSQGNGAWISQKNINTLWNNRTIGNNILKIEYDVYLAGLNISGRIASTVRLGNLTNKYTLNNLISNSYGSLSSNTKGYLLMTYYNSPQLPNTLFLGANNTPEYNNFPYGTWLSVQLFVEYKNENGNIIGGSIYVYIPGLNILKKATFTHNEIIELLEIAGGGNITSTPMVIKYDNIKLTALSTLPTYLSTNEYLSNKFNLYPNPATNVVNIGSAENKPVSTIAVYTIAGKLVSTQNFSNQTNIQLNTENLTSGTYMLHLQTNEGTVVKKLVKK